jgi:hypothetical protein
MALWFIQATDDNGENMDLFAHAKTPIHAAWEWYRHYDGWDVPDKVTCYLLRTAVRGQGGALPWEHIQRTEVPIDNSVKACCP